MTPTHTLKARHGDWPQGTPVELRASRKEGDAVRYPSGWSVLVRAADRQRKDGSWPEFVVDYGQIERLKVRWPSGTRGVR